MHQGDGGHIQGRSHPSFSSALGFHLYKRQQVFTVRALQLKCTSGILALRLNKAMVDRIDQGLRGSVVDGQSVVPPFGGLTRFQVAVNVGAPKAINRLLGVPNQQQGALRGVAGRLVNRIKNAVLNRGSVLEFINQGHRVLLCNALAQ